MRLTNGPLREYARRCQTLSDSLSTPGSQLLLYALLRFLTGSIKIDTDNRVARTALLGRARAGEAGTHASGGSSRGRGWHAERRSGRRHPRSRVSDQISGRRRGKVSGVDPRSSVSTSPSTFHADERQSQEMVTDPALWSRSSSTWRASRNCSTSSRVTRCWSSIR